MHRPVWMIVALLLAVSGITGSTASAKAKPLQGTEQRGTTASAKTGGQETATPPSRPNPDASGKYHIGDGVSAPQVIYSVDAEFTDKARKKKLSGTCIVGLLVDATGMPQDVHIVKSAAESAAPKLRSAAQSLDEKSIEAVKQYKFKPAMFQGKAVPVETTVEIAYRIY
jgi:TonB family protein